jgi:hypothetical protein
VSTHASCCSHAPCPLPADSGYLSCFNQQSEYLHNLSSAASLQRQAPCVLAPTCILHVPHNPQALQPYRHTQVYSLHNLSSAASLQRLQAPCVLALHAHYMCRAAACTPCAPLRSITVCSQEYRLPGPAVLPGSNGFCSGCSWWGTAMGHNMLLPAVQPRAYAEPPGTECQQAVAQGAAAQLATQHRWCSCLWFKSMLSNQLQWLQLPFIRRYNLPT